MSLINAISAVGNNSSVYPLIVRDCGIEAPVKIAQNYTQTAKDSKRMAMHCAREKSLDEYTTTATWIWGVPVTEWGANKIIKFKTGLNGNVNLKLLEKNKNGEYKNTAQNIEKNIQKFKTIAPDAVKDLEKVLANSSKYTKLSNNKYAVALMLPMLVMGLVIPKANFALTNYLIDKDIKNGKLPSKNQQQIQKINPQILTKDNTNFKSLNSLKTSNNVNFKGLGSRIATLSHTDKMAVTDIGLATGRVGTARGRNEKIERAFCSLGMLVLNFVTPKYIEKGLDKATKALFGINTALDPKIMADKRFLAQVRTNTLELPTKEEEVLDFIDNNPKSILAKYTKKNKLIKYLDNGIRDPREFVDTKRVMNLADEMKAFATEAKNSKLGIRKYANKAIKAKSFNIITNVVISSMLLAIALPQAQFVLRKVISGTNVDPGLIASNQKESKKLNKQG